MMGHIRNAVLVALLMVMTAAFTFNLVSSLPMKPLSSNIPDHTIQNRSAAAASSSMNLFSKNADKNDKDVALSSFNSTHINNGALPVVHHSIASLPLPSHRDDIIEGKSTILLSIDYMYFYDCYYY